MASVISSKMLLLLLCTYHSLISIAHAVDYSNVLATGSLEPEGVCSSEPSVTPWWSTQSTVALNYRYGPCSAKTPTFGELLDNDKLQADNIRRRFFKKSGAGGAQELDVTVPAAMASDAAVYVMTVGLGSPAVNQTMIIDTSSDVSWVHCKSSSPFDPSKSSTYAPFPCSSVECTRLADANYGNGCSNSECQYTVSFVDGSKSSGIYSSDTLALSGSVEVKNFQFGCSHADKGTADKTDGLMALGGDSQSFVSQTAATYGRAFSYCLPRPSRSGFFTLGAPGNASGFVTTPMLKSNGTPTFYSVLLQGIAVDGKLLDIPTSVFSAGGGSVMSTGVSITRLPRAAYTALKSAFREGMKQYPLAAPKGYLDTCFDLAGLTNFSIPSVSLVFSGDSVVRLNPHGILFGSCLGFAATSDISIIGNVQQRTIEVMYDVAQSVVGFRPGAC